MATHKIRNISHNTTHKKRKKKSQKFIVFDLDETIGHFSEIGILIEALSILKSNHFFINNPDKKQGLNKDYFHTISKLFFNQLMDMYPEFLRPNIIKIFKKIRDLKKKKNFKVVIYTNNMGPRNWTLYIKNYIEYKINSKIFDKIITKYDKHHKHNCRTTHRKTYNDLVRCLKVSGLISNLNKNLSNLKILFFDDQTHNEMKHKNIKYIKLIPYQVKIPFKKMVDRFNNIDIGEKKNIKRYFSLKPEIKRVAFNKAFLQILNTINNKHLKFNKKKEKASRKDLLESKKIIKAIQHFTRSNSRKKNKKHKNKTYKKQKKSI